MAEDGDGEFAFDLNEPPLEHGNEHVMALVEVNHRRKERHDRRSEKTIVLSYHFFGIILPGSELTFALLVKHLEHNASGGGGVDRERARPVSATQATRAGLASTMQAAAVASATRAAAASVTRARPASATQAAAASMSGEVERRAACLHATLKELNEANAGVLRINCGSGYRIDKGNSSGSLVNSCEDGGQEWQICVPSYLYTALNVGLHREVRTCIISNSVLLKICTLHTMNTIIYGHFTDVGYHSAKLVIFHSQYHDGSTCMYNGIMAKGMMGFASFSSCGKHKHITHIANKQLPEHSNTHKKNHYINMIKQ
uniref:Uncharacterized protein n=1 Tax=Oryza nivara TaxID=4536 RepID=A0A0E0G2D9_ORYNI